MTAVYNNVRGIYMKKWLVAVLFGAALVLGACGGGTDDNGNNGAANNDNNNAEQNDKAEDQGGTVDTAAAEKLYENNCSGCHGADLTGGMGPDLTKVGSTHSAKEIEDIIHNGTGQMPAQSQVSDEDATTIANWLADKK